MREGERDIRREGGKGRRNASSIGINQRRSEVKGRVGGDTERHMKSRIDVCVCVSVHVCLCICAYLWIRICVVDLLEYGVFPHTPSFTRTDRRQSVPD